MATASRTTPIPSRYSPAIDPANWQAIPGASLTADSTGAFQYTNTPSDGMGFYRTVYP